MLFVYIHGFNSSPESFKARCFGQYLSTHHTTDQFLVPKLSDLPVRAMATLEQIVLQHPETDIGLIGSSLGGFYATRLAQDYQLPAVLVNPAVNPQELLLDYLGSNRNIYTGEEYEFTREHIAQLEAINTETILVPERLLVLLQTGDEILDYRLAEKKYSQCHLLVEAGGDHSFQNFARYCERIHQFLTSH